MIRIGQREFVVPLWLWAALPVAFVLYACVNFGLSFRGLIDYLEPDQHYLTTLKQLATASLAAFLLTDLASRSRTPWYGLPLLYLASSGAAIFLVSDLISGSLEATTRTAGGMALSIAAGPRGGGGGVLMLYLSMLAVPLLLAIAVALLVTVSSRFLASLPLLTRDTRREYWANLGGASVWLLIALGGYLAIRFSYNLALGGPRDAVPRWLRLVTASGAGLAATALHLYVVHRSRRGQSTTGGNLKVWLVAGLCVVSIVYKPEIFGVAGVRVYYDYVRPAMRAVDLLRTSAPEVRMPAPAEPAPITF